MNEIVCNLRGVRTAFGPFWQMLIVPAAAPRILRKELDAGEAPGKDLTANEPNKRKSVIENLKFALNAMTKTNNQFTNTRLESQLEKYVTQINSSSIDDDK